MKAQEVFDTVVAHLAQQKCASSDGYGECLYRGPHGTRCAVGCLIPDNLYDEGFEGQPVDAMKITLVLQELGLADHSDLLCSLQNAHDGYPVRRWPQGLRNVAKDHQLDATKVDELMGLDWVTEVRASSVGM